MKHYRVWDNGTGKVFATFEEAKAYTDEIVSKFGIIVLLEETYAAATHVYMGVAGK